MSKLGVSANVDPSHWAGAFECDACRRKRLPASEFSRKTLESKLQRGLPGKCKKCTDELASAERARAGASTSDSPLACSACSLTKPASAFSRTQTRMEATTRRCAECVERAARDARAASETRASETLREAREASARAEETNAVDKLATFAREAAMEATIVTGLKPQRVGGRGRGRGRGRSNPNSVLGRGGRT